MKILWHAVRAVFFRIVKAISEIDDDRIAGGDLGV